MSKLIRTSALASLVALAVPSFAQTDLPPAYLAVVDGDASLVRDGDTMVATVNMPIVNGDRLTTAGRAEVLYPDGVALDLDAGSTVEFGRDGRVRLSSGRAILVVPDAAQTRRYEIETPTGTIATRGPGKYRAEAATSAWALDQRATDAFDGWSDGLRAARAVPATSASATYLPEELQSYTSTLDQNGTWQYAPTYGYVWYPRVDSEWRPYYDGTWTTVPAYGWTWVGVQRWAYPTHHYGRWAYANNHWFWIPGRAYSPAWVAWGYSGEYVSWSPLGIDGRPAVPMTVGYGNPWAAWTVVPKTHFGARGYVPRIAVSGQQVSQSTPFVVQNRAPSVAPMRQPPVTGRAPVNGTAVPRVAPTPSAPPPPPPQTIVVPPTAVPRNDNPAYAPHYAPRTPSSQTPRTAPPQTPPPGTTPPPPATPPPSQTPPAASGSTPQRTPPQKNAPSGGGAGMAAPRKEDAPPPKSGDGSSKPAEKPRPAEKPKPAEGGKARGRGGLLP